MTRKCRSVSPMFSLCRYRHKLYIIAILNIDFLPLIWYNIFKWQEDLYDLFIYSKEKIILPDLSKFKNLSTVSVLSPKQTDFEGINSIPCDFNFILKDQYQFLGDLMMKNVDYSAFLDSNCKAFIMEADCYEKYLTDKEFVSFIEKNENRKRIRCQFYWIELPKQMLRNDRWQKKQICNLYQFSLSYKLSSFAWQKPAATVHSPKKTLYTSYKFALCVNLAVLQDKAHSLDKAYAKRRFLKIRNADFLKKHKTLL